MIKELTRKYKIVYVKTQGMWGKFKVDIANMTSVPLYTTKFEQINGYSKKRGTNDAF